MFEGLTQKFQQIFDRLGRRAVLTEADVDAALREIRLALLEADVHYTVVRDFLARVRERAVGAEVTRSLTPAQQVIRIVYEELVKTLGSPAPIRLAGSPPHIVMLVGLQGSGKTTTAAKLALRLRKSGQRPLLVAADIYRPAAITQLEVLGRQLNIPVYQEGSTADPIAVARHSLRFAREHGHTLVILDTAGRLHIDDEMMRELEAIRDAIRPGEILLVVDAMTGQDAVRAAEAFHQRLGLTGLILTKLDGDARGGAAISIRAVTGVPIKFIGVGEKPDQLEPFQPERLASRILGMGDVLALIEKAQEAAEAEKAAEMARKLTRAEFTLEDFREQLRMMRKMGPLSQLLELLPGYPQLSRMISPEDADRQFKRIEAIINSMTPEERRNPEIINASRKRRIARGSGTTVQEVNQLLNEFRQLQRLMKQMKSGRGGFPFPFLR
ncbi:signal recognition particle protein [Thermoflexus sp.]|uniref:signal recognition particle protein n=2 Tax=Thermoflexus sp. TaxID=1969742 RepID=UPI0025F9F7B8|nr:signal recognition particle protein [Thermoflexus sp.]MCS6964285.1 signal recognition particle protein [Thermoflexus sp.]MCX7691109.1 signal recognition particle protein [Thermoflexus sp.]MDW8184369.1 signal recognition particle protein [Anaerolineae bacterium]